MKKWPQFLPWQGICRRMVSRFWGGGAVPQRAAKAHLIIKQGLKGWTALPLIGHKNSFNMAWLLHTFATRDNSNYEWAYYL